MHELEYKLNINLSRLFNCLIKYNKLPNVEMCKSNIFLLENSEKYSNQVFEKVTPIKNIDSTLKMQKRQSDLIKPKT